MFPPSPCALWRAGDVFHRVRRSLLRGQIRTTRQSAAWPRHHPVTLLVRGKFAPPKSPFFLLPNSGGTLGYDKSDVPRGLPYSRTIVESNMP